MRCQFVRRLKERVLQFFRNLPNIYIPYLDLKYFRLAQFLLNPIHERFDVIGW